MAKSPPEGIQRIVPYLAYADAAAAIEFLCKAFGFEERFRLPMPDGRIGHAELAYGGSVVMLASAYPEMDFISPKKLTDIVSISRFAVSPKSWYLLGNANSQEVSGMSKSNSDDPIRIIQVGPVKVHIHRTTTPDGFPYMYWQPGRVTKRNPFAQKFSERDDRDAIKAIQEAVIWIKKNPEAADVGWDQPQPEQQRQAA